MHKSRMALICMRIGHACSILYRLDDPAEHTLQ